MSNIQVAKRDKVPVGQKAAFGAGHFILNILPGTLGVFIQFFLLTAWGVDPLWAGLLGGLPRIFDALTDPIMGFISDNTTSKWGRRRPYIFLGAIISGVLLFFMWQLDDNASETYIIWHVMIVQILFLVGNTMFATPLVGLGYEMTSDYNERTRLMSFANSMGQVAWMIVPWLYVIIPDSNISKKKKTNSLTLIKSQMYSGPLPHPDMLAKYEEIEKGTASRIIKMAENQSEHRQTIEKRVIQANIQNENTGMFLAFFMTITIILASAFLVFSGKDVSGLVMLFSGLGIQFINYFKQKKKESNSKK